MTTLTFDNLMSGFIGVLVGALVSFCLVRYRLRLAASKKLAGILFGIEHELIDNANKSVHDILEPNFNILWELGIEVANLHYIKRKQIKNKIGLLCGLLRVIEGNKKHPRSHRSFPKRDDAKKHINDLLDLLGY